MRDQEILRWTERNKREKERTTIRKRGERKRERKK